MLTVLPDGRIAAIGGADVTNEVFDPQTMTWSPLPDLPERLRDSAVAALADGSIMLAGGFGAQGGVNSVLIQEAGTDRWVFVDRLPETRTGALSAALPSGRILVAGGSGVWRENPRLVQFKMQAGIVHRGDEMDHAVGCLGRG